MSYKVVVYAQQTCTNAYEEFDTATPEAIENDDFPFGTDEAEFDERPALADIHDICEDMWLTAVTDCFDRDDGLSSNVGLWEFRFTAFIINPNGKKVWKSRPFTDNVQVEQITTVKFAD